MAETDPWLLMLIPGAMGLLFGVLCAAIWRQVSLQSYREYIIELQTLLEQERQQNQEKLDLLTDGREEMRQQFNMLAGQVLDDKTRRFHQISRQGLTDILKPLQDKISQFEKKVEDSYSRESRERFSLEKEIRQLQALNNRIGEDALNLTRALKGDSKTQGAWGEFILSSILEASGLEKGREYETQVNLQAGGREDGASRSQPDVLVHLPDKRQVIVDSKVSLTAYERYCSAESEASRREELLHHVQSVRNHIRQLSDKRYHTIRQLNSLDFVLLFMPVEPAFSLALQEDPELFNYAFERQIVIAGPSTLLATLRTIHNVWRYEQQNRNALEIASRAGALYDKFVGFVDDMDDLGQKLESSHRSYEAAMNKLQSGKGNLIGRTENLKKLGARASKQLPEEKLARDTDAATFLPDDVNDEAESE